MKQIGMASRIGSVIAALIVAAQIGCLRTPDPNSSALTAEERVVAAYLKAWDHKDLNGMRACLGVDAYEIDGDRSMNPSDMEKFYREWFSEETTVTVRWSQVSVKDGKVRAWVSRKMGAFSIDAWLTFSVRGGKIHEIYHDFSGM